MKYGMIADLSDEIRIIHLAYQFAEVHCSDTDILGKMAQELLILINKLHPQVKYLPSDEEE